MAGDRRSDCGVGRRCMPLDRRGIPVAQLGRDLRDRSTPGGRTAWSDESVHDLEIFGFHLERLRGQSRELLACIGDGLLHREARAVCDRAPAASGRRGRGRRIGRDHVDGVDRHAERLGGDHGEPARDAADVHDARNDGDRPVRFEAARRRCRLHGCLPHADRQSDALACGKVCPECPHRVPAQRVEAFDPADPWPDLSGRRSMPFGHEVRHAELDRIDGQPLGELVHE